MFSTLQALADALGVPVLELFHFDGAPEQPRRGRPPKRTVRPTAPA
jgi:hypothetical protein